MELIPTTVGWRMPNPRFPAAWVETLGRSAELVAEQLGVGRLEQDEWALRSHELAAPGHGRTACTTASSVPHPNLDRDEPIRETDAATLAALRPGLPSGGSVTAGNSSPISDGAVAALVGTGAVADELGVEPLGRVLASAVVGAEPDKFALAPVAAISKALDRAGLELADVRVLSSTRRSPRWSCRACVNFPGIPADRVNPFGGAIALGHPLGASAARMVVDCLRHLRRLGGGIGVAAACIGVGQGIAIVLEA